MATHERVYVALGSNRGDRAVRAPELTIPHPELPNRDFWLREIAELDASPEPSSARRG